MPRLAVRPASLPTGLILVLVAAGALGGLPGCSSEEASERPRAQSGKLVEVLDLGDDMGLDIAMRGDDILFVTAGNRLMAIPPWDSSPRTLDKGVFFSAATAGEHTVYLAHRQLGVVVDWAQGRAVALTSPAPGAKPDDPGLEDVWSLAYDPTSGFLYAADLHKVDRIDLKSGRVETWAEVRGESPFVFGEGIPARKATFLRITAMAVDPATGVLYLGDGTTLRSIDPSGVMRADVPTSGPGRFEAIAFDERTGDLFFSKSDVKSQSRVFRRRPTGAVPRWSTSSTSWSGGWP